MGELWRDLVDLMRRRPALWLPVLVADLLGYLVNLGRSGLLRALVLHNTAQHSALGGVVVHGPMTASAMESTTVLALLLSWITYFIRILLYSGALIATAALVSAYLDRQQKPVAEVGPRMRQQWGVMFELALRVLAAEAIVALLLSWLSPYLVKHGQGALLHTWWFTFCLSLLVLLGIAALVAPVAVRLLSGREPGPVTARQAQQFSFVLVAVIAVLSTFMTADSRQLAQVGPGARYPLEIVGSLVVALPYALLFVGLSLLARKNKQAETDS